MSLTISPSIKSNFNKFNVINYLARFFAPIKKGPQSEPESIVISTTDRNG